jgi:REP element-mobilizing transposase RayT
MGNRAISREGSVLASLHFSRYHLTMARPLRIEFPGALYHVTSRGDRREPIYEDDADREQFLATLAEVVERYNWLCHAYCLMTNHYHLILETVEGNLSKGMRQLNGVFTQSSNRRHGRQGHLFQGRFKGILVDKDSYLLELSRYVVLNPVRAGMAQDPEQWFWSSYRATAGESTTPPWLETDFVLRQFAEDRDRAQARYRRFVLEGLGRDIWQNLRQQIYLGDETFVEKMQAAVNIKGDRLSVPNIQRRPPPAPLADIAQSHPDRNSAILAAYATGAYSYAAIAAYFGIHLSTVGRIVRTAMQQCEN